MIVSASNLNLVGPGIFSSGPKDMGSRRFAAGLGSPAKLKAWLKPRSLRPELSLGCRHLLCAMLPCEVRQAF